MPKGENMTTTQLIVNVMGLAVIAFIVWYFWLYRRKGLQVAEVEGVEVQDQGERRLPRS